MQLLDFICVDAAIHDLSLSPSTRKDNFLALACTSSH